MHGVVFQNGAFTPIIAFRYRFIDPPIYTGHQWPEDIVALLEGSIEPVEIRVTAGQTETQPTGPVRKCPHQYAGLGQP